MSFQEIILLLTFIGSCIYATISLTLKVLEFLLQNKKEPLTIRPKSAAIIIVPANIATTIKNSPQNKLLWLFVRCIIGNSNPGPTDYRVSCSYQLS